MTTSTLSSSYKFTLIDVEILDNNKEVQEPIPPTPAMVAETPLAASNQLAPLNLTVDSAVLTLSEIGGIIFGFTVASNNSSVVVGAGFGSDIVFSTAALSSSVMSSSQKELSTFPTLVAVKFSSNVKICSDVNSVIAGDYRISPSIWALRAISAASTLSLAYLKGSSKTGLFSTKIFSSASVPPILSPGAGVDDSPSVDGDSITSNPMLLAISFTSLSVINV